MSERASSSAADDDVPSTTGKNSGEDEDPQSQTQSGHGTDTNTKRTNTEKRFTESIQERYSVGRLLGEGAFSIVRKAKRRKDGFVCALKIIDKKDSEESTDFRSEIDILCKVDHPNCVAFYEWTETKSKVVMCMELVTGGTLLDRIISCGNYSEEDARIVFRQIASALQYLHSKGIAHRDLKPDNVMLAKAGSHTNVKVTDFGLSKILETQDPVLFSTVCGTPQYLPPEVVQVIEGSVTGYDGKSMDLYGLGTLLYVLLSGTVPFYDKDEMCMFNKIRTGTWEFHDAKWQSVHDGAKEIITELMRLNPSMRMSLEDALDHEWARTSQSSTDNEDEDLHPMLSALRVNVK